MVLISHRKSRSPCLSLGFSLISQHDVTLLNRSKTQLQLWLTGTGYPSQQTGNKKNQHLKQKPSWFIWHSLLGGYVHKEGGRGQLLSRTQLDEVWDSAGCISEGDADRRNRACGAMLLSVINQCGDPHPPCPTTSLAPFLPIAARHLMEIQHVRHPWALTDG